jgi:hypothetical protein
MSIDWKYLRTLDGSRRTAFEELCRQLAYYENVSKDSKFFRIGAPDAGVECYWKLPNEKEIGWQAKFFTSPPDENQWKQVDKSIETALEKHPDLTQYYVCFPLDRQDPRIPEQEWFMDKWDARVKKWEKLAKEKGISITFDYWGESDIWDRLSRSEHRGRYKFWFDKELFDHTWFERQIKPNIENVGERYSAKLNFELPIAMNFDGLARTQEFFDRLESYYKEIKKSFDSSNTEKAFELSPQKYNSLNDLVKQLQQLIFEKRQNFTSLLALGEIKNKCSEGAIISDEIYRTLEQKEAEIKKKNQEKGKNENPKNSNDYYQDRFSFEKHYLWELQYKFSQLGRFVNSDEAKLSNTSAMLLTGIAGNGKTHLFCDVAERRLQRKLPTILLLGQHFSNNNELWSQILNLLSLDCTRDQFLGALEASAQAEGSKALILIDALNESDNRTIWKNHLAGILEILSKYKWISLAVSVRSSYEEAVIPDGIVPEKITKVEHLGFGDKVFEAASFFFREYGIKAPSIPLLNPEFQNPLFLKIFCKSIKNLKLSEIPKGLQGINSIFDFFIKSINKRISEKLGFDIKDNQVNKVVENLADAMIENGVPYLLRNKAKDIVSEIHTAQRYEDKLFYHLWSEGLLSEDIKYDFTSGRQGYEIIRFTYEKLNDNLIAKRLLERFLDKNNPEQSFLPTEKLGRYFSDEWTAYENKGTVEALFTLVPELLDKEVFEIVPQIKDWELTKEVFIQSLLWREPTKIFESSRQFVNEKIISNEDYHYKFLDILLIVSSNPQHKWNADYLNQHLRKFEMPERDAWWSIFLHAHYTNEEHSAIHRIIDWAWSNSDKSHIDDESIRLCGVTLAWFLTTSNRFIRDRTTKALVSLFTSRIKVLRKLIEQFLDVNDLYVLERLFAVAYGCSMRSNNNEAIKELAQSVYDWIFKDGKPIRHILLRDYARGVIEVALYRELNVKVDVRKIRPPYKTKFPENILTEEELKKKYRPEGYGTDEDIAQIHLYESVMGYEDFSRYIINNGFQEWRNRRLDEPLPDKIVFDEFEKNLSPKQKNTYEEFKRVRNNIKFYEKSDKKMRLKIFGRTFTKKDLNNTEIFFQEKIRMILGRKKQKTFDEVIIPYLEKGEEIRDFAFNVSLAKCWILQRVYELGWKPELFGQFDRYLNYGHNYQGRTSHKVERIGKKYQWIALHEFMAYVADNFQYQGDSWSGSDEKYLGTWQVSRRDIDPSSLLKKTELTFYLDTHYSWWFPVKYDYKKSEQNIEKWLRISDDLPKVEPLIQVTNPKDNSVWLNLDSYFEWSERNLLEDETGILKLRIWYSLNSYLVRNEDFKEVIDWARKQNFSRLEMPDTTYGNYRMFLGEYYWSPAYNYFNIPYFHHNGWTKYWENRIPKEILLTTEEYSKEGGGYDCSIEKEDGFRINLPTKFIVEKMNLNWNGVEGHFFDKNGELIAFDPSLKEKGNTSFLIRKDKFQQFLNENNLSIFWILRGEKLSYDENIYLKKGIRPLEISGVYAIEDNEISGSFSVGFEND